MFEYKVVPAPDRAVKVRGLKTTSERFAHALTETLNALSADGWEFLRSETLPCEERKGWFGGTRATTQTVMIFCKARMAKAAPDRPLQVQPDMVGAPPAAPAAPAGPTASRFTPMATDREPTIASDHAKTETARTEPVFRPGAMIRAEGDRKFPSLRQVDDHGGDTVPQGGTDPNRG